MPANNPLIMTAGPTMIHEDVRRAMSICPTNPDLDPRFLDRYESVCKNLAKLMHTANDVIILCGEGILGLEAACASLIEPGDRVLCLANGIFGKGFGDFARIYGAEVIFFESDFRYPISPDRLELFLQEQKERGVTFKLATLVHCETPSGIINPVDLLCPLLHKHGVLTVVDSVSAIGGEPLCTDAWQIDICLGGSQKCLSAAPGLTFMSVSPDAWAAMEARKQPIIGFYANLTIWRNIRSQGCTPYTFPVSDLQGFELAVDRALACDIVRTHKRLGEAVRNAVLAAGLSLYPFTGYSNTVTAIEMPEGVAFGDIFDAMLNTHNIMIAGAFDVLDGKVLRIGHMGENCREEYLYITLKALDSVLRGLCVPLKEHLHIAFTRYLNGAI